MWCGCVGSEGRGSSEEGARVRYELQATFKTINGSVAAACDAVQGYRSQPAGGPAHRPPSGSDFDTEFTLEFGVFGLLSERSSNRV